MFCTLLAIGSVIYFLSSYTSTLFDDIMLVQPIVIALNKPIKEKIKTKKSEADKSPLFKSVKLRYNQIFPQEPPNASSLNYLLNDGTYIS